MTMIVNENITTTTTKYRSRDEIIGSILQYATAEEGITKTRIMYNSFLSYSQLKEYIDHLIRNKLLSYSKESKRFKITGKGLKYLELYSEIHEMSHRT